jgi:hypothetical protein
MEAGMGGRRAGLFTLGRRRSIQHVLRNAFIRRKPQRKFAPAIGGGLIAGVFRKTLMAKEYR